MMKNEVHSLSVGAANTAVKYTAKAKKALILTVIFNALDDAKKTETVE